MAENRIDLKKLTTEQRNENTMGLDRMSPLEIVTVMNREDENVVRGVRQALPEISRVIEWTVDALNRGGRLIYMGAGTSGRLGVLDAVECPPTFGVSPDTVVGLIAGGEKAFVKAVEGAEDDPELGRQDLIGLGLRSVDVVVGLAASGRTPYVIGGLDYARSVGCHTAAVACNKDSEVGRHAETAIEVVSGPEVLTGSTRLKSGTAQKMVLNMISTASMVGCGKAYENLMVDVQQTNRKLVTRAENMVMTAVGCSREEAQAALKEAGGSAKTAITMLLLHCSAQSAREKLAAAGGKIGVALGKEKPRAQVKGSYFMAMDGGGTATIVYLADRDGKILERLTGGPMNPNGPAAAQVRHTLEDVFEQAAALGYVPERCLGAGLGVAGISNPSIRGFLEGIFRGAGFACPLGFWGDDDTALAANLEPGQAGAILISGTGSICVGRDGTGAKTRSGGFGSIMDDGGSGYAIARDALAAIVRAEDGRGPKTALREAFLEELHVPDMGQMIRWLYDSRRTKGEIAALAAAAARTAEAGDLAAEMVLEQAARQLAELADVVLSRLPEGASLLYSGSVLKKNPWVRRRVSQLLKARFPADSFREASGEAALGALRLIMAQVG